MNEGAEGSGRTLEEAKQKAAEALGLAVDQCEFEVIEERPGGLFARAKFVVRAVPMSFADVSAEEELAIEEAPEPQPIVATEADAERARALVDEMLSTIGFDVEVTVESITGKYVNLKLQGPDEEWIQRKKGAVLDAIQFLGNALFSHGNQEGARLTVDVGTYRSNRQQVLEKLAREIAALVIEKQEEAVLDPLPAHERRIIHNALKDVEGVETYSEGEEPQRYVVIAPKGDAS